MSQGMPLGEMVAAVNVTGRIASLSREGRNYQRLEPVTGAGSVYTLGKQNKLERKSQHNRVTSGGPKRSRNFQDHKSDQEK